MFTADKDGASRMQSSSLELLRRSPFSHASACKDSANREKYQRKLVFLCISEMSVARRANTEKVVSYVIYLEGDIPE